MLWVLARARVAGVAWCAIAVISASAAEADQAANSGVKLSDLLCSRLQFVVSADGSRAVVHDAVMNAGTFVSRSPFAEEPSYTRIADLDEPPWWMQDGRVVFEWGAGHVVFNPATGARLTVKVDSSDSHRLRISHPADVLPHIVGREYFVIADGAARNVRAVDIETGKSRIVIRGSAGKNYPLHLYVAPDGREIAREYQTEGRAGSRFVLTWRRRTPAVQLDSWESLDPLFTAESFALSRKDRFLAVHTRPSGDKAVVSVDTQTLRLTEVLKLRDQLPPVMGLSPDGTKLQWHVDFAPLPVVSFSRHAPRAIPRFVGDIAHATLSFQSQSRDGRTRVVKLRELSGRTRFGRVQRGKLRSISVPCRQPATEATAEELKSESGSGAGWIVHWHGANSARRDERPIVVALPDRPSGAVRPNLDPVLESMAADGADVHLLIYPGSWPSSDGSVRMPTGSELLLFAQTAIDKAVRSARGRPVILVGYGTGASIAFRLASTSLAGRVQGILAIAAKSRAAPLPLVERGGEKAPRFAYPARDVPAVFLHGSVDDATTPSEIERLVRDRGADASVNRCIVIDGMGVPNAPFHWREQEKAFRTLLGAIMSRKPRTATTPARQASPRCDFVELR